MKSVRVFYLDERQGSSGEIVVPVFPHGSMSMSMSMATNSSSSFGFWHFRLTFPATLWGQRVLYKVQVLICLVERFKKRLDAKIVGERKTNKFHFLLIF